MEPCEAMRSALVWAIVFEYLRQIKVVGAVGVWYFFIRLPNEKQPMTWPVFLLYNKFRIHNSTTHVQLRCQGV